MLKRLVLAIVGLGKALFYGTPVHRWRIVNAVYRWLFHLAYGGTGTVRVSYESHEFDVPAYDITILPSLLNDDYEKAEIALVRSIVEPGMTFVDVGANIGLFSVIAADLVGPTGRVISFEPEPGNVALLTANAKLNRCDNIDIVPLAVGQEHAFLDLQLEDASVGTHSLLETSTNPSGRQVRVEVVRLDDFLLSVGASADVLKVDVEGYEPFVLQGARQTLASTRYLLVEYSRARVEVTVGIAEFAALLSGFPHLYAIDPRRRKVRRFAAAELPKAGYLNLLAAKAELPTV